MSNTSTTAINTRRIYPDQLRIHCVSRSNRIIAAASESTFFEDDTPDEQISAVDEGGHADIAVMPSVLRSHLQEVLEGLTEKEWRSLKNNEEISKKDLARVFRARIESHMEAYDKEAEDEDLQQEAVTSRATSRTARTSNLSLYTMGTRVPLNVRSMQPVRTDDPSRKAQVKLIWVNSTPYSPDGIESVRASLPGQVRIELGSRAASQPNSILLPSQTWLQGTLDSLASIGVGECCEEQIQKLMRREEGVTQEEVEETIAGVLDEAFQNHVVFSLGNKDVKRYEDFPSHRSLTSNWSLTGVKGKPKLKLNIIA